MTNREWTDDKIVAAIQSGGGAMEMAVKHLYIERKYKGAVFGIVLNNGGTEHDALDVLQESMAQLVINIQSDVYEGHGALSSYFYGIARWKWVGMKRGRDKQHEALNPGDGDAPVESADVLYLQEEYRALWQKALEALGGTCKDILSLTILGYSMKEIAQQLGYGTDDVVKNLANRCRKRFREMLSAHPKWSDLRNRF